MTGVDAHAREERGEKSRDQGFHPDRTVVGGDDNDVADERGPEGEDEVRLPVLVSLGKVGRSENANGSNAAGLRRDGGVVEADASVHCQDACEPCLAELQRGEAKSVVH